MTAVASVLGRIRRSPVLARVLPFAVFAALTTLQGTMGDTARFWIYLAKTLVGAWLLWVVWSVVAEMRWRLSLEAAVVGVGVFGFWVGLDGWYPRLGSEGAPWNPFAAFPGAPGLAWGFVMTRLLGSVVVVPPLEEVFYRSFIYRYVQRAEFESVPLTRLHALAFVTTSVVFGLTHREWLAGILCGFAYQGLVCWKGRLADAMTAHAITNLLLGLWIVAKGAWQFW